MIISLIVAMDEKGGIGWKNTIPWHLTSDLKRFKNLTMGHHLIMGRKTFEAIGKPLPGRVNLVITRNPQYQPEGCQIVENYLDALRLAEKNGETEVFVIGGAEIYRQALPSADLIYLTKIHGIVTADTYFPALDELVWETTHIEVLPREGKDQFDSTYMILTRISTKGPQIPQPGDVD